MADHTALSQTPDSPDDGPKIKAKRTSVACTRCRQLRVRCMHDSNPPCSNCTIAGKDSECILPPKGTSLQDRAPRGLRKRRKKNQDNPDHESYSRRESHTSIALPPTSSIPTSSWPSPASCTIPSASLSLCSGLPTKDMISEGINAFFYGFFQLGFIHRPTFLHTLETQPDTISQFLLLTMLSISARFTPCMVARYGSRKEAVDFFAKRALGMSAYRNIFLKECEAYLCEVMGEVVSPSLERTQGLYLLSVNEWGRGFGFRSRMLMAMALQMADQIQLTREGDTFNALELESRRRLWWFLIMNTNILSLGMRVPNFHEPMHLAIPLPSHEEDFSFGCLSSPPSYFPGSKADVGNENGSPTEMSLLGTMISIAVIWGRTARYICGLSEPGLAVNKNAPPWMGDSLIEVTLKDVQYWLSKLNNKQKWSIRNLLAYKNSDLDLAFYNIFLNFHVLNIAVRRQFLPTMLKALNPSKTDSDLMFNGQMPPTRDDFWAQMALTMLTHAFDLIELQGVVNMVSRIISNGGTPFMGYGVYLAGTIINYLRYCPWLCPEKAPLANQTLISALDFLQTYVEIWPISTRWYESLVALTNINQPAFATELASHDIDLDKHVGLYRQYEEPSPVSNRYFASETSTGMTDCTQSQLDAASTLAQLSGGMAPIQMDSIPVREQLPTRSTVSQFGDVRLDGMVNRDDFASVLGAFLTGDNEIDFSGLAQT